MSYCRNRVTITGGWPPVVATNTSNSTWTPAPPDRIARILLLIEALWRKYPEWRLGQLLANATHRDFEVDPFYFDDDRLEEDLRDCF